MQLLNLFLLSFIFIFSCNNSTTENKKIVNFNKNEIETNKIKFIIQSPSEKCFYEMILNKEGEGGLIFLKENEIKIDIKIKFDVKYVFDNLATSEVLDGKLWKGGWNYKIYYNNKKKVEVYKKQDSKLVMKLLDLLEKYYLIEIDYTCF